MDEKITCVYCGCEIDPDNVMEDYAGDPCCEDCFYDYCAYCDDCGDVVDIDLMVSINDGNFYVCKNCADSNYYRCDHCGSYYTRDKISLENDTDCICDFCAEHYGYVQCEDCGEIMRDYNANWSERDGVYYCDYCYEEHCDSYNLHDYGYKPDPEFLETDDERPDARYYGVELEIDEGNDANECADALVGVTSDIYCKRDGSLGGEGVEIVTHPATLNYHLTELAWDRIIETATDNGYTSHDAETCGLHVHVGRAELPDDAPEKILAIIDNLWDALVIFSRRKKSQLHRWADKPDAGITVHDNAATGKDKADKHKDKGRYQAINLRNQNTIEFRLFRGSLVLQTIRATLQCVDLICEYATNHTLTDCASITWDDFKQTGDNLDDFCAYCNKRGL